MTRNRPTYRELERRLATAEPIVEALKRNEVDAVVGEEKIAVLLLHEVGAALQNSDAGFRAMFELSGVGMVQADAPSFRFTKVNQKFCEISGYTDQELLKQSYIGLTDPRDRQRDMKGLARVIQGKADSWSIEKRCVRKDGSVIWLSVSGTAMRNDEGRAVKVLAMITDITADKEARSQLSARSIQLRKLSSELTMAEQRERRRIARILKDHIDQLLLGVKSRTAAMKAAEEKTVRQALKDVQDFIDQSISPAGTKASPRKTKPTRVVKEPPKRARKPANDKPPGKTP